MSLHDIADDWESYRVVVNDEAQYSIWPSHKALPAGWKSAGKEGIKAECLAYIRQVWTDMRPLSLSEKSRET
jgi:MbtH protein